MDPAQLQPGHRLDRYELLCPLAYGGMASVWLARFGGRKGFERLVVVKMILPQYSQDPRFQEMFVDEARIASRIEHANVARIVDVGEQEESTFIVMEWVDGDSLSKVVRAAEQRKQRIPAGIALRICADAAAGLHAAHVLKERDGTPLGVVHRDVSPQNILISNAGSTVIIDFGVAKARDRVSQETSAGQLKGKIRYMAPEQALGRNIDHRADVWALGAILYELFAGVPPYDGPNEVATLHKLTSGNEPAPLPAHVPPAVRAVIDRALAYDAEERYATSLELNLALEACMIEIGEPTSVAVVAQYTGQLLAERKSARKRAVDTALAAAHARDASDRASSLPMPVPASMRSAAFPPAPASSRSGPGAPGSSTHPQAPISNSGHQHSAIPFPIAAPSQGDLVSSPSNMSVSGLSEVPSATSSATLGSAAMEYPPQLAEDPVRRRRYIAAAVLGVSVAAGVVGAVLIISTAILKHSDGGASGSSGAAHGAQTGAPPESTDPGTSGNAANAAGTTPPPTSEGTATTAAAAAAPDARAPSTATAPTPTEVRAPAPTTTVVAAAPAALPAPTSTSAQTSSASSTHRPSSFGATPAATAPKPVVKPPSTTPTQKPTDRGF